MKTFWEFQTVKWGKVRKLEHNYATVRGIIYLDLILAQLFFDEHVKINFNKLSYLIHCIAMNSVSRIEMTCLIINLMKMLYRPG